MSGLDTVYNKNKEKITLEGLTQCKQMFVGRWTTRMKNLISDFDFIEGCTPKSKWPMVIKHSKEFFKRNLQNWLR